MAGSMHGKGSAFVRSNNKQGGTKGKSVPKKDRGVKHKDKIKNEESKSYLNCDKNDPKIENGKNKCKIAHIVFTAIFVIALFGFICIYYYAKKNGCSSVFYNHISETGVQVYAALFGAAFSAIYAFIISKENLHDKWKLFVKVFLRFMVIVMATICFSTWFSVKGKIAEVEEKDNAQQAKVEGSMQIGSSRPKDNIQTYYIVPYQIDTDLYMQNRPLNEYYGDDVSEAGQVEIMAEILVRNLVNNKPEGSKTPNYIELTQIADGEYETYLFQRQYCKDREDRNETLFSDRIEMLQKSLEKREQANKEYSGPENERPLATGYRDMGDEYFGWGKQNEAIEAYEESAEWFMKAIYHAVAMGNYEEMNLCMDKFENLGEEVIKLDKVDEDRKNDILLMIQVYDAFVNKVVENTNAGVMGF